jgi:hypothetical protein
MNGWMPHKINRATGILHSFDSRCTQEIEYNNGSTLPEAGIYEIMSWCYLNISCLSLPKNTSDSSPKNICGTHAWHIHHQHIRIELTENLQAKLPLQGKAFCRCNSR